MATSKKRTHQMVVVLAIIHNEKGQFLLDLRSDKEHSERNMWELPGGKIEFGEKPTDAVQREIREELGVEIEIEQLLPTLYSNVWEYDMVNVQVILVGYLCNITKGIPRPHNDEAADISWIYPDEISRYEFLPHLDSFIRDAVPLVKKHTNAS